MGTLQNNLANNNFNNFSTFHQQQQLHQQQIQQHQQMLQEQQRQNAILHQQHLVKQQQQQQQNILSENILPAIFSKHVRAATTSATIPLPKEKTEEKDETTKNTNNFAVPLPPKNNTNN